jgi:hypothetical protein
MRPAFNYCEDTSLNHFTWSFMKGIACPCRSAAMTIYKSYVFNALVHCFYGFLT